MKVLLLNGSPHAKGCTYTALREVAVSLEKNRIETEIVQLDRNTSAGCLGCGACHREGAKGCFQQDMVNEIGNKLDQYDAIVNIWASNNDCAFNIPFYVQLNAEETERYNELSGDLATYVSENHLAFITGAKSFDEFDSFIAQCKNLGAEEIVSLYQTAWDRTMG